MAAATVVARSVVEETDEAAALELVATTLCDGAELEECAVDELDMLVEVRSEGADNEVGSVDCTTELDDDGARVEFDIGADELGASGCCAGLEDTSVLETDADKCTDAGAGVEETDGDSDTETGEDLTTEGEDAGFEEDKVGELEEEEEEADEEEVLVTLESCETLEDEDTAVDEACSDGDKVGPFPAWPEPAKSKA